MNSRRALQIFLALLAIYLIVYVASQTIFSPARIASAKRTRPLPRDSSPLPMIAGPSAESRIDPRLSRAVSLLAGRRVQVRCWSVADWDKRAMEWARWADAFPLGPWGGYTSQDRERVNLAPAVCTQLTRLVSGTIPVREDGGRRGLAWSVGLLAHEAQHVRAVWNEAVAECNGTQEIERAAGLLGRTAEEGRYLASLYWTNAYRALDPDYRSPECRNGGRLDVHPETDTWP